MRKTGSARDESTQSHARNIKRHERAAQITSFTTGLHFGLGLALSGMLRPSKVAGFLNLSPHHFANGTWDPSLAALALAGILPASFTYFTYILPKITAQRSTQKQISNAGQNDAYGATTDTSVTATCPGPVLVSLGANKVDPSPSSSAWSDFLSTGALAQPGTVDSFLATALFTVVMAVGGLLVK
ncbi:hypothetical protein CF326_g6033 [Tilletia indica]|nr:hypothetical protein CF326_g6033 [Tilletia indica]